MRVLYRTSFLRDLKKLKKQPSDYEAIYHLAFEILPHVDHLQDLPHLKPLTGYPGRYRLRLGDYRLGLEVVEDDTVEVVRVLPRRDFYRYFP